jgi:hypothetical protein
MSLPSHGVGRTFDHNTARARSEFESARTKAEVDRRAADIEACRVVEWKGRTLRTLRCHGTTGKGPHDINVPEGMLWTLLALNEYVCAFHGGRS